MNRTDPRRTELLAIVDAALDVTCADHYDSMTLDELAGAFANPGGIHSLGCWSPDSIRRVFATLVEEAPIATLDTILARCRVEIDADLRRRAEMLAEDALRIAVPRNPLWSRWPRST